MDFITGLPIFDSNNVIYTLRCKLIKKGHHVFCLWDGKTG